MLKKLFMLALVAGAAISAKAQTQAGNQNLGLSFAITSNKAEASAFDYYTNSYLTATYKQKIYNIAPQYSYFIADKLDLGVSLGYTYVSIKGEPTNNITDHTQKTLSTGIFLRKYFLFDNRIGVRLGPYFNYNHTMDNQNNSSAIQIYKTNGYAAGANLDFVYYPAKNIGLAAGLGNLSYTHSQNEGDLKNSSSTFNLSFVNNVSLSVFYVFGSK